MIVTELVVLPLGKYKVFIDEEFAFVLYKGELRLFQISVGEEVLESHYETIISEVLPKRAKSRSLHLLDNREYTEFQLRAKLKIGFYSAEVIDEAIAYVKSCHYIDDEKYTRNYITCYIERKSKRIISQNLHKNGIATELVLSTFEELEEEGIVENPMKLILKELQKKHYDKANTDEKKKQKIISSLYRKGFSLKNIKNALNL